MRRLAVLANSHFQPTETAPWHAPREALADPYRITDRLNEDVLEVIVARLEASRVSSLLPGGSQYLHAMGINAPYSGWRVSYAALH